MSRFLRITILCIACAACRSNGFLPEEVISGLRVLAVTAEPPEIAAGESTTMTALAVDITGTPITIDWAACTLAAAPGQTGANPKCITNPTADYLIQVGSKVPSSQPVPFVMPMVQMSQLGGPDQSDGFYLPIRLEAAADMDTVTAVYNLRYFTGLQPRNHNPTIASVDIGGDLGATAIVEGTPGDVPAGGMISLSSTFTADSIESYPVLVISSTGPPTMKMRTEELGTDWFVTAGDVSPTSTAPLDANTTLDLSKVTAGTKFDIYLVAHDDRGGTSTAHRELIAR